MNTESRAKVASIFRAARKLTGKTQVEVARHLQVSQSCVSKIEAGKLLPSVTEWFRFAQFVQIRPDESYHYGFIDHALPVHPEGVYAGNLFKVPSRYSQNPYSKVRSVLPFIQHFQDRFGTNRWEQFLAKEKIDPDFFLVYDAQLSPQFSLDLVQTMIEGGVLLPQDVQSLAQSVRTPAMHGRIQQEYSQIHGNRELIVNFIQGIDRYERNFTYVLEDQNSRGLTLSVTPRAHMSEVNYRNSTFGDFLCRYKKNYLTEFSTYSGDPAVTIEEKQCHFHGSDQCIYQIQTA